MSLENQSQIGDPEKLHHDSWRQRSTVLEVVGVIRVTWLKSQKHKFSISNSMGVSHKSEFQELLSMFTK